MTVETVNVSTLKRVKNKVIGNPSAKIMLAQDELFVATSVTVPSSLPFLPSSPSLVKSLNAPEQFEDAAGSQDDIRVEAAHVITSLSYGAQPLLRTSLPPTHSSYLPFLYQVLQKRSAAYYTPMRTRPSFMLFHVSTPLNPPRLRLPLLVPFVPSP
jgi:hypothetical protein